MTRSDTALVEALYDEPFYQRLLVDTPPHDRKRVLAAYFAYSLAEAGRTGRAVNDARMIAFMGPRGEAAVPPDAWYLSILGVHPSARGRGLGAALVEPTIAERFYAHLGLTTCASHHDPTAGVDHVIMRLET